MSITTREIGASGELPEISEKPRIPKQIAVIRRAGDLVRCVSCNFEMSAPDSFCSKCGAENRANSSESAAPQILAGIVNAKENRPISQDGSRALVRAGVILSSIAVIIFIAAAIVLNGTEGNDGQLGVDSQQQTLTQKVPIVTETKNSDETIRACKDLLPVLESSLDQLANRESSAEGALSVAAMMLNVNRASRTYDVNTIFADTTVPMDLPHLSRVLNETLIAFELGLDNSTVVIAKFTDALYADVIEPCFEVGVEMTILPNNE